MSNLSIINDAIQYIQTDKKSATHFALCNRGKIRYFISLSGGKKRLTVSLSSYSKKHKFLMGLINFTSFKLLKWAKLGYFIKTKFCDEIAGYIDEVAKKRFVDYNWNLIVGTYNHKQKLVSQCYGKNTESNYTSAIYFKIGNKSSEKEMTAEIDFLQSNPQYKSFVIPTLICCQRMNTGYSFNIQVTEEFIGCKVKPAITDNVYEIFKEIVESRGVEIIDGIPYGFSHGDFAPWNLKVENGKYTVFDWEHCGMRFYGFDLIHYVYQIETLLNGSEKDIAMAKAIEVAKKYSKTIKNISEQKLFEMYFDEATKIF